MKRNISITILLAIFMFMAMPTFSQVSNDNADEVNKIDQHATRINDFVAGEVLVKFKESAPVKVQKARGKYKAAGVTGVDKVLSAFGVEEMEHLMPNTSSLATVRRVKGVSNDVSKLYYLRIKSARPDSTMMLVEQLKQLSEVEYAEPNYKVYSLSDNDVAASGEYDDPLCTEQWGNGQLKLNFLWKQKKITDKRPVIAILDTGIDITHPDLVDNIWTNASENDGVEGEDDDNNGFEDDLHGWDFVNNTNRIGDWNGHGTHCAGIAAATGNNKIGITGANPDALIMPVTVMQSDGTGDVATIIKGIDYAVANGATVISMSFGGYAYSMAEEQALAKAYSSAVLVAAAGNDNKCIYAHSCDINEKNAMQNGPMFPAAFTFVLGVEAGTQKGDIASFSNFDHDGPVFSQYGEEKLYNYELRGPGASIMSTYPGGKYKKLNGTSMACPYVAGAISRLLQCKEYGNWEILFGDLIHARKKSDNGLVDFEAAYKITDADRKPSLGMVTYVLKDTIDGDGDGKPDAGETIAFYPTLRNEWGQAKNIRFTLELAETEDPTIVEILDTNVDFGKELSSYGKNISANPVRFKVRKDCADGRKICMVLRATCDNITEELVQELTLTAENGVEIGGLISEDMTLYPNVHYIVTKTLAVQEGAVLTILPGTILKFKAGVEVNFPNGTLNCVGEPDNMIVFTMADHETDGMNIINFNYNTIEYVKFSGLLFEEKGMRNICMKNCIIEQCQAKHSVISYSSFYLTNLLNSYGRVQIFGNNLTAISKSNVIGNVINDNTNLQYFGTMFDSSNAFGNMGETTGEYFNIGYYSESPNFFTPKFPNYLGSAREEIVAKGLLDMDNPIVSAGFGDYNLSNMLTRPSAEAHGIVWKVVVNGYDAQDEFEQLPPLGVGKHKFEVYFSRPMDTSVAPMIAMGVRPPYTSHSIAEDGSWNEDGTVYTSYLTIDGKTVADGLNRIYVADALESCEDYYYRKEIQNLVSKTDSLLQNVRTIVGDVALRGSVFSNNNVTFISDGDTKNQAITADSETYYVIDLGEHCETRLLQFNYWMASKNNSKALKKIMISVQGSNDKKEFKDITNFPHSDIVSCGNQYIESPVIDAGIPYRYYRILFSDNIYLYELGVKNFSSTVKDEYQSVISEEDVFEIQKNVSFADYMCYSRLRDIDALKQTLSQLYADYNKLAAILNQPTIEQSPIHVPSAPAWVVPVENKRFNVQVAAAGSMATGLMAEAGLGKVSLTWETDEEDFEDLLGYNIYRYTIENGISSDSLIINENVIDGDATSYVDYDVVPGTTYYYVIKQLTTSLNSHALSNAVAATPLTASLGDANGDTSVDVADVMTVVNYASGQDPKPFIYEAADMNTDKAIDILDVIGIIQKIINPSAATSTMAEQEAVYTVENGQLFVESPVALAGVQVQLATEKGTAITATETLNGFEQVATWLSDNDYLFLGYNMSGKSIAAGKHAILNIGDSQISDIRLSDTRGHRVNAVAGNTTSIDRLGSDVQHVEGIYTLTGVKISGDAKKASKLPSGVYIINGQKVVK